MQDVWKRYCKISENWKKIFNDILYEQVINVTESKDLPNIRE